MSPPVIPPYIDAVPINAITAGGFGPLRSRVRSADPAEALRELQRSREGRRLAMETIGTTGERVLLVLNAFGGVLDRDAFHSQTAGANPAELDTAIARLVEAGLVHVDAHGTVSIWSDAAGLVLSDVRSMALPQAVTNEEVAAFCRSLGVLAPKLKHERLQVLREVFADPTERTRIRRDLSDTAHDLLAAIGDLPVIHTIPAAALGLEPWDLRSVSYRRPSMSYPGEHQWLDALHELGRRGIIGADPYTGVLWVWREAWPMFDRPLLRFWSVAERPPIVTHRASDTASTPGAVAVLDALLARWRDLPPAVLKNDQPRLARLEARATAKAIGSDEPVVDVLARLAISLRLVLRNEVARSGRGRNQRIELAWKPDPDLTGAWAGLPPRHRWARLVAEWCASRTADVPLLVNRHLLLWELQRLDIDAAYQGDTELAAWMGDRYGPLVEAATITECLADLRALGVVSAGDVALTPAGRALLADPRAAVDDAAAESTRAFVQADLTVIAPPDLRHDLVLLLERIATVQSSGGATIYRLDERRIAKAVQAGDTADTIVEQLRELAGADLPDTVTRLVHDAAARASAVRLITAATVLIVDDPADLTVACAIKSLRLTRVSPTVAATDVTVAKVQAALDAKGLNPKVIAVHEQPTKRAREQIAQTEKLIERLRESAERHGEQSYAAYEMARLQAGVKALGDFDARLAVPDALTLTPVAAAALVDGGGGGSGGRGAGGKKGPRRG